MKRSLRQYLEKSIKTSGLDCEFQPFIGTVEIFTDKKLDDWPQEIRESILELVLLFRKALSLHGYDTKIYEGTSSIKMFFEHTITRN